MENNQELEAKTQVRPGITITALLLTAFLVLLGLRLSEIIDWSWWWITLPLWIVPALGGLLYVFLFNLRLLRELAETYQNLKNDEQQS